MDPSVAALEPKIRQILSAPGIDLSTISAKRVRKQLLEIDSTLTQEFVRGNKEDIDRITQTVYEEISQQLGEEEEEVPPKRARDEDATEGEGSAPPKKAKKTKTKQEQADEEYARQLQNEINGGRARSARATSTKAKANGTKRGKKGPKSSATVNSDGEEESGEEKPKKRGGGFKKEYALSPPLAALLGVEKLARPQVVKQLWDHIKANNMQNPDNRKEIICDEPFRAVFGVDKIDMFKMNKELGSHLYEPEAAS
ncbi:SWIB-domain-containing protein [Lentinus tigrinus ALCF2SS1-7]|uniref:SWIB-domain-containing protein n=1 Tax=Lentinus tigrinus ALCF2SS1-6 TaxID=1328759 RepID=A0A5C2RQJ2_9APHY|nr:SWIB-domain-containing protein [Lentinus tigrinus ALCF2SS1-6]RPD68081.1 SWIB-domain-containing protein [Lentinus tigrinus ALCF2SS1-7]